MENIEKCCCIDANEKSCNNDAVYWIGSQYGEEIYVCEEHKDVLTDETTVVVKLQEK